MTSRRGAFWGLIFIALVLVLYVSTCSVISYRRARAFEGITIGQTEHQVIGTFGKPSVREEIGGIPFRRYTAHPCEAPCAERLWFENRLGMDLDAWSVELSGDGKVIKKSHWVSP